MTIHAHLLCWNEKDIMPFVIRYYQSFCDKITIHDNHSTDGSAEWARLQGCEVIPFGDQFFNDQHNMDVKNNYWKGSDADYVIVADFDEILAEVTPDGKIQAPTFKGIWHPTIPITIGWQIMSEEMPKESLLEISNGYIFGNYAKNIVFDPKAITNINYGPGAHECEPEGLVVFGACDNDLYVLHYKHIGGVQRTIDRYKAYNKRMSKTNLKNGWGIHYRQNERRLRQEWAERMAKSRPL